MHERPAHAELLARPLGQLEVDLVARDPAGEQLVGPELEGVEDLDAEGADLVGVEHAHRGGAAAVRLDIEERVDDAGRDLVEEVRRLLGGAVDQNRVAHEITSRRSSTTGT